MHYTMAWFNVLVLISCSFIYLHAMDKPLKRRNSFYQEIIENGKHYDASKAHGIFLDRDENKNLLVNDYLLIAASSTTSTKTHIEPIKDFEGSMTTFEIINETLWKITTEKEDTQEQRLYFINTDSYAIEQTDTPVRAFIVYDNEKDALNAVSTLHLSKQAH